ncbi:NADH dehydrogenase 1 beta subcomplex subunit 9 [Terfezia boudieri ATCC MYA-4762]|uniref:NADH dehydrogenase [ubiquinone] 1 beta subcomplex subunit 9 n=1 Tax=Terfezia boudieri ATCC MYA-4762 TaxID=1051890 RepID=A0A3N4LII5_9PEZI|nr:NADH dehydrogenase 1 beta subcomplex subunit 9 [Terfezia boudieri ATCC MYA-4762]
MASKQVALNLYRQSLKLSLSWCVRRDDWRKQAVQLRHLFELNRHVTDPRIVRGLLADTAAQLEKWKHPDIYVPPTAPGGSKYERNIPPPYTEAPPHFPNI